MRVAIFFDGKNYYSGWRRQEGSATTAIAIEKLADWLVTRVGGSSLWGAYYYTAVESRISVDDDGIVTTDRLTGYLNRLEYLPGFFVRRFRRASREYNCSTCGAANAFTQEKEVDTTMVADMLRLAAVDAFDIAIVVSGDTDHAPAVEGVRDLGKKIYVASWGRSGMASRLIKAAFDHIDLLDALPSVAFPREQHEDLADATSAGEPERTTPTAPAPSVSAAMKRTFVDELARAEEHFGSAYVGASYFLNKWRSPLLTEAFQERSRILNELLADGAVEVYETPGGDKALRVSGTAEESTSLDDGDRD